MLGGSSAINSMMAVYPSRADLDAWAALGNPEFLWDEMAPYFQKFTTFHPPSSDLKLLHNVGHFDKSMKAASGPIHLAYFPWLWPASKAWLETWENLGLARKSDPRSGVLLGGGSHPVFFDPETATRSYAGSGYYAPNVHRRNLSVLVEAYVNKIELDTSGSDVRATGVNFTAQGKHFTVTAKCEVVLCAGTVKSPQLLEVSGIGSPALLESHGIAVVVANESVGENLRDHPLSFLSFELADGIRSHDSLSDPAVLEEAKREYQQHRTGPMATAHGVDVFSAPGDTLSDDDKAALAILLAETYAMDVPAGVRKQNRILADLLFSHSEPSTQYVLTNGQFIESRTDIDVISWKSNAPGDHVFITASITRPFGRGSIHITTADPTANPAIDPRYHSHPVDRFMLAKHLQHLQRIVRAEPLASQFKPDGIQLVPCPPNMNDEEALNYIALTCTTEWHPIGTCAMLPREDGGVVDPRLKVYGIANLRVVDASIFPIHVQNNICSTVYAVAEKAADMIKEDWY
jgi:choline dehydrogenase